MIPRGTKGLAGRLAILPRKAISSCHSCPRTCTSAAGPAGQRWASQASFSDQVRAPGGCGCGWGPGSGRRRGLSA